MTKSFVQVDGAFRLMTFAGLKNRGLAQNRVGGFLQAGL
jgi:hypothetical protein